MAIQLPSMGNNLPHIFHNNSPENCLSAAARAVQDVSCGAIACYYNHTNRHVRNIIAGSCATCLSYWGGVIAGDMCCRACLHLTNHPNTAARIGSLVAALGNLCSWISGLEPEPDYRIEEAQREIVSLRAHLLDQALRLEEQNNRIKALEDSVLNQWIDKPSN